MSWSVRSGRCVRAFSGRAKQFPNAAAVARNGAGQAVVMMNENISALLDDELEPQVAEGLLDRMRRDEGFVEVEHLLRCRRRASRTVRSGG